MDKTCFSVTGVWNPNFYKVLKKDYAIETGQKRKHGREERKGVEGPEGTTGA